MSRERTRVRQRPIRSTLTVLLIIPLLSLMGLWAYAAASTVGGAIAKRNADTINRELGAPMQALIGDLATERADAFVWQSAHSVIPRASLEADRKRTDAAVAAFRAGAAAAEGSQTRVARQQISAIMVSLGRLGQVRAAVDHGTIQPLAAFQDYNGIVAGFFPFVRAALNSPDGSILLFQQGQATVDEAQALELIGQEAALAGGALVSGGKLSAAEYRLFAQDVDNQRLLDQIGASPLYWQQSPDPYPQFFASRPYQDFKAMEDRIVAAGPGARIPVSPLAWQSAVQAVVAAATRTETTARVDVTKGSSHAGNVILLRLFGVGGAGLAAVIISALLLLGFGNRITRELTSFRQAVRAVADERLPGVVRRLRQGEDVDVAAEAPPLALRTRTREVTETADAFSAVQRTAVEAAVGQAQLRKGVSNVFRSLARRNQSLLQRQLKMLDEMERGTHDPEALAQLFRLDHLTTRMRRQAEGLIILSGAPPGRGWRQPVPVVQVLRGATSEIENYVRVDLATDSRESIQGAAVADVTHLLAELIENATLYSPPRTRVQVKAGKVANGYVVEIEDRGLGIPAETLDALNERLAKPPEFDLADSDQLGLFVVSRLAARHGIRVSLRGSPYGGTAAIVLMPPRLIVAGPGTDTPPAEPGRAQPRVPGRPEPPAGRPEPGPPEPAHAEPAHAESASAGTDQDLPRRTRQASLAPQLREPPPPDSRARQARSAEQTRALISSIQQGWRRAGQANGNAPGGDDP